MCFIFHKWSKWKDFKQCLITMVQVRECERCGKKQSRGYATYRQ